MAPFHDALPVSGGPEHPARPTGSRRGYGERAPFARRGGWRFSGDAGGAVVGVRIAPLGGNAYRLSVEGNADVSGIQAPVTVGLTIGNDSGSTSADLDD